MADIFKEAKSTSTALKAGLLGFAGTGKTFTATLLAIGLSKLLKDGLPIAFFDSENGSDYLLDLVASEGLPVPLQAKSNTFADLIAGTKQLPGKASILIVDSISAVWSELKESYTKKLGVRKLQFQHWNAIKSEWAKWPELYLNSPLHIIVCGRAGFEYDYSDDEGGDKELVKTGTKMKVESEFGFEPSLLIEMVRERTGNEPGAGWTHKAAILKDRSNTINGKVLAFPGGAYKVGGYAKVFDVFLPVIKKLNIGGTQVSTAPQQSSEALFSSEGQSEWQRRKQRAAIASEEIAGTLGQLYPGQDAKSKSIKQALLKELFGTYSWSAVEAKPCETLEEAAGRCKDYERYVIVEMNITLPESVQDAVSLLRTLWEAPRPAPVPAAVAAAPPADAAPVESPF